jgi:hypothetical protein
MKERKKEIKFLVVDPESSYIDERARELRESPEEYKTKLIATFKELINKTDDKENIKKRYHKEPPVFRFLILQEKVYFSFFEKEKKGTSVKVIRANAKSEFYRGLNRYFEYIWNSSEEF